MAIYFLAAANDYLGNAASNSNDGRDPAGFDLSGASYDDTGHADGDYRIESSGAFSGYTWESGDLIYIDGGTGITVGLYEIAEKVSNDVIRLTASAGSDASDLSSSSGPFATLNYALKDGGTGNTMSAGDELRVMNDGSHEIDNEITTSGMDGTSTDRVLVRGVDDRGVPFTDEMDRTNRVEIRCAASTFTGTYMLKADNVRWTWQGLKFNCHDSGGTDRANRAAVIGLSGWGSIWMNCEFENGSSGDMVYVYYYDQIVYCDFHDNTDGSGCNMSSGNGGRFYFCRFYDNNKNGLDANATSSNSGWVMGCEFFRNGSGSTHAGLKFNNAGENNVVVAVNCVMYDNYTDGMRVSGELNRGNGLIYNCSFVGNGQDGSSGYGLRMQSTDYPETWGHGRLIDFNHFHNNYDDEAYAEPGGAIDVAGINDGAIGQNNQTGDPSFADADNGDFTPGSSSPLIQNGLGGFNIGTGVHAAGGSGGAGRLVNGGLVS